MDAAAAFAGKAGTGLAVVGALSAAAGVGLMTGEYAVRPNPGDVMVWSRKGCWLSFMSGMMLLAGGVHSLAAGIGMIARGRQHGRLARIMRIEGPSPVWDAWYATSRRLRIGGHMLSVAGTFLLYWGLVAVVPHDTCDRWECRAWPEYGSFDARDNPAREVSVVLIVLAGVMYASGGALMAAGYAKQWRVLEDRHVAEPRVLLSLSPGGLVLAW
jgi:hypothetical protein